MRMLHAAIGRQINDGADPTLVIEGANCDADSERRRISTLAFLEPLRLPNRFVMAPMTRSQRGDRQRANRGRRSLL